MVKSLIIYFSQSGTTRQVAEAIASGMRGTDHHVDLHDMNDGLPSGFDGHGLVGIGFPVYIFRPPFKVMEYIQSLPDLKGLPVFVFLLHGTTPGDAGNIVRDALSHKGGREVGYFKAKGADYFLGYLKRGYLFSPDSPTKLELDSAQTFGRNVAELAKGGTYVKHEYDSPPSFVYWLERFLTNKWFVKFFYSWVFSVKSKKCNSCGLCMKVCPVGNITENKKGHPVWGRNCQMCLYCEMKCPKDAIISPGSWPTFAPFIAYNIWKASNNPLIDRARVVHENGRTKRLDQAMK